MGSLLSSQTPRRPFCFSLSLKCLAFWHRRPALQSSEYPTSGHFSGSTATPLFSPMPSTWAHGPRSPDSGSAPLVQWPSFPGTLQTLRVQVSDKAQQFFQASNPFPSHSVTVLAMGSSWCHTVSLSLNLHELLEERKQNPEQNPSPFQLAGLPCLWVCTG